LLIKALRMKGVAQLGTDLALSPMTGKGPKRYGIRIPSGRCRRTREQVLGPREGWSEHDARAEGGVRQIVLGATAPGPDRFGGRVYDLVKHDDGTIGFVRNAWDAELDRILVKALDEVFGSEAEPQDVELLSGTRRGLW
jgi:hypothetical protein